MHMKFLNSAAALTMTLALCGGAAFAQEQKAPATAPNPLAAEVPAAKMEQPKKKAGAGTKAAKIREMQTSTDSSPSFTPDTYEATKAAAERYQAIADNGGWPRIGGEVKAEAKGEPVRVLAERLAIEGDLPRESADRDAFDDALTQAVKSFQLRMGLKPTGVVTGATLDAINITAAQRARQLADSAQRIENVRFDFAPRHVIVNIPAAAVEAVEGGTVVHRYTAVVGDKDHQSPQVTAKIQDINLNPTWTIPTSIVKNEIIPKLEKNPNYLKREKIHLVDSRGREIDSASVDLDGDKLGKYTLKQESGAKNSLGQIRINMPNKEAVYLHDTPAKGGFAEDYRFLSHGCVRVQGVMDLAAWLLEGAKGDWDAASIKKAIADEDSKDIKLAKPVPVIWTYLTGFADKDGVAQFRDDVYGLDAQ
ncbi:MAG: murein L,D-transpeptidase [Hyphomicrobiales bacterium]|jgi:murein L,D-transpeptidase YcbB/YkuD|nr:murein L,D-transpeptidase [Hyphomicrobiales bacterium]